MNIFKNKKELIMNQSLVDYLTEEEFFYQAKRKRKKTHKKSDHKHEYENYLINDEGLYCLVGVCKHCGRIGNINREDLKGFSKLYLQDMYMFFPGVKEDFLFFCKEHFPMIEKSLTEIFYKKRINK